MWIDYFVKIFYLIRIKKIKHAIIAEKARVNFVIESKNSTSNLKKESFSN